MLILFTYVFVAISFTCGYVRGNSQGLTRVLASILPLGMVGIFTLYAVTILPASFGTGLAIFLTYAGSSLPGFHFAFRKRKQ